MRFILRWLLNSAALLGIAYMVPSIEVNSFYAALIVVVVLGLVNALIRPLVILITLPVNILTLGLFTLVINGLMFWLVSTIVKGFDVAGFWPAFWGALLYSVVGVLTSWLVKKDKDQD